MTAKNVWEQFYDNVAMDYYKEPWCDKTVTMKEVDFLEKELNLTKGMSILDVGCGIGRHSLELARRGYKVTGIDILLSHSSL